MRVLDIFPDLSRPHRLTETPGQEWLGAGGVQAGGPGHRVGVVPVQEHHGGLHGGRLRQPPCRGLFRGVAKIQQSYAINNQRVASILRPKVPSRWLWI